MCCEIPANEDYDDDECVHPSSKFSLIWISCINFMSKPLACTIQSVQWIHVRFVLGFKKHVLIGENLIFLCQFHGGKFACFFLWFELNLKWEITTQHYTDFFFFFFCISFGENRAVLASECIAKRVQKFTGDSGMKEKNVRVICFRVSFFANAICFPSPQSFFWLVMRCKCDKIRSNVDENDERWTLQKTS